MPNASILAAALAFLTLAGCSTPRTLNVFAASSLGDAFEQIESAFEATHPGIDVVVSVGGSNTLANQINQGAPVDVFASADTTTMQEAITAGEVVGPSTEFATNTLVIIVAAGNPIGITQLVDLAAPDLKVVLADPNVPAGAYTSEVLVRAGVAVKPVSLEQNVRAVLAKVALGEADAGIVYYTDAASEPSLVAVAIPIEQNVQADYVIGRVDSNRGQMVASQAFIDFLLGATGRHILLSNGFGLP